MHSMQSAPEIGNFVFEESPCEREDAVDGLCELEEERVVDCVWVDVWCEEAEKWIHLAVCHGEWGIDVAVAVV